MQKKKTVYLNEKIAKKLIKNEKYGKALSARVISEILEEDYNTIYNNITLSSEEIAFSALTVSSTADGIYYNDYMYINLELNFYGGDSKKKQLLSYGYQLYLGQLHTYENYHKIKKVLQISIDSHDVFQKNEFIYHIKLMEEKHHIEYDDSIEFVHINLDFLNNKSYNEIIKSDNELMKTLYFLICDDEEKIIDLYGDDELMKKIVDEAKKIAGIEKMHLYLTDEEMRKQDEEYYYNKGKADGIEEGIEQGIQQGIEQGIIQTINLIQTIKKMLKQKISIEDIAKCTGKSIEDINMIINNL